MRILITGVAGHLGSRFAAWLLEHVPEARLYGIDNLSCGYRENVPAGVELWEQDVGQVLACRAPLFAEPFDYVFHFAAYAAECLSPFVRCYNYTNNLVETAALVNHVLDSGGCRRLVFTSSIAVYGAADYEAPPFHEDFRCEPLDPYGVAKLACEHDLRIAGEQHGLDWCILRPHNIYGPGQSLWQKYRNVFGLWLRAAFEGRPLPIFGDGQQRRAFTYIDDILPCLWQAAVSPQASRQIINLGGEHPIAIAAAAEIFRSVVGCLAVEHFPPRHEVRDAWCTVARSQKLLGYRDQTPLGEGLARMLDWAADAWQRYPERRYQPDPFTLELTSGLPPSWATASRD